MRASWGLASALLLIALAPATAATGAPTPAIVRPAATGAPWTAAQIAGLDRDLDALVAGAPTLRGAHVGIIVETPGGKLLYAHDPDATIQPASTFKLLVGSVALDRLGPGFRFRTTLGRVPAVAPPGGVAGPEGLVLHGGGDPLLRRSDLEAAADAAQRAGLTGPVDLRIDTSAVSPDVRKGDGWQFDDVLADYAPVVNGLPYEENVLDGWLDPAPVIGAPATLRLTPPFGPQTIPAGTCPGGPTLLTFDVAVRTVAASAPETVDVTPGRCGEVVLRGDAPQGHPTSLAMAVDAPEALARIAFADALGRRGITAVAPPPATAAEPLAGITQTPQPPAPGETAIWTHDGEPLGALLGDFWMPSDNLVGEELFYALDAALNHHPGGPDGASAIERAWLRGLGVDPASVVIADGSGLSQYDRITPRILGTILRHDWNGPNRDAVLDGLPVLGVRGDLRHVGAGTPVAGRVFAKGGSMMHVRGLAGFGATADHGAAVIVISVDDWLGTDDDLDAFRAAVCERIVRE
jgi:D-alanyl-D-alanine carboxypeptidase/D-alanyl-D-alanine-endopeptidase (penicillin-binding protein 4)